MARAFDIVTFDGYGTLVDWEGGISEAFLAAAAGGAAAAPLRELSDLTALADWLIGA